MIFKRRLVEFCNEHNVFVYIPTQFGFCENSSTTLVIAQLREQIIRELDDNANVCATFITKAFRALNLKYCCTNSSSME